MIEKIKSGERVEILNDSENWWLIKTNSGNKGYVYRTKIKSE
ncbi:SH3 domain-containing protein [Flavobacterium plurextorum]